MNTPIDPIQIAIGIVFLRAALGLPVDPAVYAAALRAPERPAVRESLHPEQTDWRQ